MILKVKKLDENAHLPLRATEGAAAADLYALCGEEGITLAPGARAMVHTGIAIELESSAYVALLFARSGLAVKHGLSLANSVGVIDSDYRGEICVALVNLSAETYTVTNGERVAQLAIMPVALPEVVQVQELSDTARGEGGFGSTGKQ